MRSIGQPSSQRQSPSTSSRIWARGVPAPDEHRELRLVEDPGVAPLEPVVVPAHGFVAPFHLRLRARVMREIMRPGPDQSLHGCFEVFEHARHAVAVAVVPTSDHEGGDADRFVILFERRPLPKRTVPLHPLVGHHPGFGVEAVLEVLLVDDVVGRAGPRIVEVLAHLPRIHVDDAVHEVHVVLVEVVGGADGDDGLEGRRISHREVDRIEAAPRDAEHAHIAIGEGLLGKPIDDDFAVVVFLVGVFVGDQAALAVSGAAHIDAGDDVAAPNEVGVQRM